MGGLSICLDSRNPHVPIVVFEAAWRRHYLGAVGHGSLIYCVDGVNFEGDVLDAVTVLFEVLVNLTELLLLFGGEEVHLVEGAERGGQDKGDVAVADDVGADGTAASFEAAVCDPLETHARNIIRGGDFGVADVPVDVVIPLIAGDVGGGCWLRRGRRGDCAGCHGDGVVCCMKNSKEIL